MLRRLFFLICTLLVPAGVALAAGYIETTDSCLILKDVKPGEVYLQSAGVCNGRPGRVFVDNSAGEKLKVYTDGRFSGEQVVLGMAVDDAKNALDQGEAAAKKITLQKNRYEDEMQKKAKEVNNYYNSNEFQAKMEAQANRILGGDLGVKAADYYPEILEEMRGKYLDKDERIYVFVSSSMPKSVIRTYADDIARLGDARIQLVMRGLLVVWIK